MKIVHGWNEPGALPDRCVLTIGNFDGVHRGHQRIVSVARELAGGRGLPVVALTFEPHPLQILTPERAPDRLTLADQKLEALAAAGVDVAVVLAAEPGLLQIPAIEFIRDGIVARLHPTDIVEGLQFGFGRGRKGSVQTLRDHAAEHGYRVHVIDPVLVRLGDGRQERVSSSLVRQLVQQGDVALAREALGRDYLLRGQVVEGAQRGRELGFPTANLRSDGQLVPAPGVYAAIAIRDGVRHRAAVSIGTTPTFDGVALQVEAHLLDFSGPLYGKTVELAFRRFLRAQRRFAGAEELAAQIEQDIAEVRKEPC